MGNRIENRRAYPGQLCNEPQLALAVRDMNLAEEPIELYRQLVSLKCVDGIWTDTGVLCWEDGARAVNPWGQTVARCRDGVWGPP
ncbi:MAG: hypothetical protein GTN83_07650 [Acidobacteria bacterium]|nr:hypothetical protein [Acidobacteriota bacterium]